MLHQIDFTFYFLWHKSFLNRDIDNFLNYFYTNFKIRNSIMLHQIDFTFCFLWHKLFLNQDINNFLNYFYTNFKIIILIIKLLY